MPHISLSLYPGRSRQQLEQMSQDLRQCLVETAGWKPGDISVSVEGIEADKFAEKIEEKIKTEEVFISSDYIK